MPTRIIEIERPAPSAAWQLLGPLLIVAAFSAWFDVAAGLSAPISLGVPGVVVACLGVGRFAFQRQRHKDLPASVADELAVCRIAAAEAHHPWAFSSAAQRIARRQPGVVVVIHEPGCRLELDRLSRALVQPVEPFRIDEGKLAAERLGLGDHVPPRTCISEVMRAALPFSLWVVAICVVANHAFRAMNAPLDAQMAIPAMILGLIPILILVGFLATRFVLSEGCWVAAGAVAFRRSNGTVRTLGSHESCFVVQQGMPGSWDLRISDGKCIFAASVPAQALPALLACWLSAACVPTEEYLERCADERDTWLKRNGRRLRARRADSVRVIEIDQPATPLGVRLVRPILLVGVLAAACWLVARKDCVGLTVIASPIALFVWHLRGLAALSRRLRELGESAAATPAMVGSLAAEVSRAFDPNWRGLVKNAARAQPGTLIVSRRRHWALPELTVPPRCPTTIPTFDLRDSRAMAESLGLYVGRPSLPATVRYVAGFFLEIALSVVLIATFVAWWVDAPSWMLFALPAGAAAQFLLAMVPALLLPARGRVRIGAGKLSLRWSGGGESTFVARDACMALTQDRFAVVTIWVSNGARAAALQAPADAVPALLACWQAEEVADSTPSVAMIDAR